MSKEKQQTRVELLVESIAVEKQVLVEFCDDLAAARDQLDNKAVKEATKKLEPQIKKYLGITLLPQAGVALGMAMKAVELGTEGIVVANITLFAVLVYELAGPVMTRQALKAAGDIKPMADEIKNRRQAKLEHAKSMKEDRQ